MHLLEVEAYFVTYFETIVDWLIFAERSVTTSKLLVIVIDISVEGMLLLGDCSLLDSFVAWCYELKCEVLSESNFVNWS